jgi:tRNA threonylcarbamoyladenosine biosynthesis protein TsaB
MALILSLETSTRVCSAAIHNDGKLLATSEIHIGQSAASKLSVMMDDVKKNAGIEWNQLHAIGITSGPGSYTGLRIGTSTAKGLCYGLDIPLISVNTLYLLAFQFSKFNINNCLICPMIDARRMEVYCMVVNASLQVMQPVEARIITDISFQEFLSDNKIVFLGDGAMKCSDVIKDNNAIFIADAFPSASQLGLLVYDKYKHKSFETLVSFEPFYLKDFVAKSPGSKNL